MNWRNWFGLNGRQTIRINTRWRVMVRDLFKCRYCGERVWWFNDPPPEMDHIYPVSRGGRNWRNLAHSCRTCNRKKGKTVGVYQPIPLKWYQQLLNAILVVVLWDWPTWRDL